MAIDSSVREAYEQVRKPGGDNWLIAGYEGNNIVVQLTGGGGVNELVGNLADDQVQYAYLKVEIEQDGSIRTKFVLIAWIGESVSPLKKGKASVDKPTLKTVIKDFAIELAVSEREDLNEQKLITKIKSANY